MADSSPRFRHDLIATALEVDGVRCVDVRDPDRDTAFRFYDFEYALALQLDGRPAAEISAWAVATYGLDLTPVGIAEFAARLSELGFLVADADRPADDHRKSERATLSGYTQPGPPQRGPAPDDDSQPLSQVVNRVIEEAAAPPSVTTTLVMPGGPEPPARHPSAEIPVGTEGRALARTTPIAGGARATPAGGLRPSSPTLAAVPRWMAELDSTAIRPSSSRDPAPAPSEPPVGETMMGFAAVTVPDSKPAREVTVEPSEAIGTVMGFAAVTETQIREAEQAASRISLPPQGTSERRMPPRPDSVVMSPFHAEEVVRRRPPEMGLRRPTAPGADRSTIIVVVVVASAVIAAVVGYYIWSQREAAMEARRVRVIAPRPAAVYRWFDATGSAVVGGSTALTFAAGGSVADVLPPGSRYAAGEIIAKLEGAAAREAEVNHARSRVAYHQQIRDSMQTAGNLAEMRRAEIKIVEKQAQLDEAEAALDRLVIRAAEAGEVADVVAKRGTLVEANAPAVLVRTGTLRGEFMLAARDADAAAHLGFCRVEVAGVAPAPSLDAGVAGGAGFDAGAASLGDGTPRFADCKLIPSAAPPGERFEVELPSSTGILLGQPLRLARVRYDGVFPVPRAAVVRVGDTDRLFVVGPGDVARARAITIADFDADEVVVSQGIDVGDRVVIDPPPDLSDGSTLTILR